MRKRGRTIPPLGLLMVDWGKHRVEKGEGRSLVPSARAPQPKVHEVQGRRYQEVGEIRRYGSLSVSFP